MGEHTEMYHNNAMFRSSIDTLEQMLPLWVNGLAEHAEKYSDSYLSLVKEMATTAPTMTFTQLKSLGLKV